MTETTINTELIDTHAHLDDPRFDKDLQRVIEDAKTAGVGEIISVGCWSEKLGFDRLLKVKERFPKVHLALGIHPHEAKEVVSNKTYELIKKLASEASKDVLAIGETGLDFHYTNSPREKQIEVFRAQIALARELKLPLIIHTREADKETAEILKEEKAGEIGGVIHCFSGTSEFAKKALDMGFYLSFTGIITFPKASELRAVVEATPIEKILVETDAPYLAPVPYRGKRCESAHVVETAKKIAEIKGLTPSDVARITTLNARELFWGFNKEDKENEAEIAYVIRDSLYLNITNKCTNACTFCAKFSSYTVKGHYLKLKKEPDFDEVLAAVSALGKDPTEYEEIVFCGFGEPLIRLELLRKIGLHFKRMGCRIRVDTDGLANLVHGGGVLPKLAFVDEISVSLNAPDAKTYNEICKSPYGEEAYPAILYFLREAKKHITKVQATVVGLPGLDTEACKRIATEDIGVAFRVRKYNEVG
ncbi:MAG: YchF/TatD family DNA exonuclease [Deltaproteobacteria bacterium]|nr:YchF/TatD family DNA exonuclease [Deltaproteobacteria bacterium]